MASILKRFFGRGEDPGETATITNDKVSETPFIISSICYLAVVFFLGVPIWFYTCSSTRYALPDLEKLNSKLMGPHHLTPQLHLDISVIQLPKHDPTSKSHGANPSDEQTNYLREHLPVQLKTSVENVTFSINWRVRRPTREEYAIFKSHQSSYDVFNQNGLVQLEQNLLKIHKPFNRFRLFMFLIDEPHYQAYCDASRSHSYTLSHERFVYLCPSTALSSSNNYASLVTLIEDVLDETYVSTVDQQRIKQILNSPVDLLFSLLPEISDSQEQIRSLSTLADKVHHIYKKNVRDYIPELKELVRIHLITQNVVDLLDDKLLNSLVESPKKLPKESVANSTDEVRFVRIDKLGSLFNAFGSRLSKHSTQNVHNVLLLASNKQDSPIVFKKDGLTFFEDLDSNFMLIANDDKSLVLQMRALIRRLVGLSSPNLCKSCLARRDVFLNRWEIDTIMGALTLTKLQNTLLTLTAISQQVPGVKIPKDVSKMAKGAHDLALRSIEQLEIKGILESYRLANEAFELSESAYFDPSLLESLYFPEDLKYAVYLPLFGPIAIPLLLSTRRVLLFIFKLIFSGRYPKIKIN